MKRRRNADVHAHELIAKTAEEMAQAIYEELAKDNQFYKLYPDRKVFVSRAMPHMLTEARKALTQLLTKVDYPEHLKEQIADALAKDATLLRGRANALT